MYSPHDRGPAVLLDRSRRRGPAPAGPSPRDPHRAPVPLQPAGPPPRASDTCSSRNSPEFSLFASDC
jgi:hypothetical protein